jgi:hypothetical protein
LDEIHSPINDKDNSFCAIYLKLVILFLKIPLFLSGESYVVCAHHSRPIK